MATDAFKEGQDLSLFVVGEGLYDPPASRQQLPNKKEAETVDRGKSIVDFIASNLNDLTERFGEAAARASRRYVSRQSRVLESDRRRIQSNLIKF